MKLLKKLLSILDLFTSQRPVLTFPEVVKLSGFPKSTALRLTRTLEESGLIQRTSTGRGWVLGLRLIGMLRSLVHQDVVASSSYHMRHLRDRTQETVCLWRKMGNARACVMQFESSHELRMAAELGKLVPLYCGGAGKILLAHLSQEETDQYFRQVLLKPVGPSTVVREEELRRELPRIKAKGVSIGVQERTVGGVGIAAPIYTANGCVDYCISLYVPDLRFSRKAKSNLTRELRIAVSDISKDLGFRIDLLSSNLSYGRLA